MNTLISAAIQNLPNLISVVNSLTGKSIPPHLIDDAQKLLDYAHQTIDNLKQNAPLTPEQDAALDNLIATIPQRDYWKSKD
jgi:hypothetical protein